MKSFFIVIIIVLLLSCVSCNTLSSTNKSNQTSIGEYNYSCKEEAKIDESAYEPKDFTYKYITKPDFIKGTKALTFTEAQTKKMRKDLTELIFSKVPKGKRTELWVKMKGGYKEMAKTSWALNQYYGFFWGDRPPEFPNDVVLRRMVYILPIGLKFVENPADEEQVRVGFSMIFESAWTACNLLKDPKLGVKILDAYMMPVMDRAPQSTTEFYGDEHILARADVIYQKNKDSKKLKALYYLMLRHCYNKNTSNSLYYKLANIYYSEKEYSLALAHYKKITVEGSFSEVRKKGIKIAQQKLKDKK